MEKVRQGVGLVGAEPREEKGFAVGWVKSAVLAIGRRQLELEALENQMDTEIQAVKAGYSKRLGTLQETIRRGAELLEQDVRAGRKSLFKRATKSLRCLFGRVGFRAVPGSVSLAKGTSEEEAVSLLQRRGLDHLVRKRLEVNKAAVQSGLAASEVDEETLHRCGLAFKSPGERFFYELDRAEIEKQP